jgi:hypothetical protein
LAFIAFFLLKTVRLFKALPAFASTWKVLTLGAFGAQIVFHVGGLTQFNFGDSKVQHQFLFWIACVAYMSYQFNKTRAEASNEQPLKTAGTEMGLKIAAQPAAVASSISPLPPPLYPAGVDQSRNLEKPI